MRQNGTAFGTVLTRADAAWIAGWTVAGIGFYVADQHGVALCASVRRVFHTDTPTGRFALDAFLGVGVVALRRHLIK